MEAPGLIDSLSLSLSLSLKVFYHYNVVQQLKGLYDGIMRPSLKPPTEEVPPEPSGKLEKEPKKGKVNAVTVKVKYTHTSVSLPICLRQK